MKHEPGRNLALWGAWLQLGPVFGLIGIAIGIVGVTEEFSQGNNTPEALAEHLSSAMYSSAIGIILGVIGIILMLVALFAKKYRARWFFWFLTITGVLWSLNYPAGTWLGVPLVAFLMWKSDELFPSEKADA